MAIKKGASRAEQQQHRMACVDAPRWELVQLSGSWKEAPETEFENLRAWSEEEVGKEPLEKKNSI